jgi:CRP-like cAMP-binding protein
MPVRKTFDKIDPNFKVALISSARRHEFSNGQAIYMAGDETAELYGIVEGAVYFASPAANQEEAIAHIGYPGQWFGFTPLVTGGERILSAIARGPVAVLCVPIQVVRQLLEQNAVWWRSIALILSYELALTVCVASDLLLRCPAARLCATLLRLSGLRPQFSNQAQELRIPITQEELAAMSNLSHSYVSNLLRTMEKDRTIELGYRELRILNPTALWQNVVSH